MITGEEFDIRAKCVVNATGPFTDAIRKMDNPKDSSICQPSSGVHIVLPDYYRYFVYSHTRVLFTYLKVRTTLYSIINSTILEYSSLAFI